MKKQNNRSAFFIKKNSRSISRILFSITRNSIIYLGFRSPETSFGLPLPTSQKEKQSGQLCPARQDRDIHGFSTREGHSCNSRLLHWWALTPPSHPYHASATVIFFCPAMLSQTSFISEAQRPVLPGLSSSRF